MIYETDTDMVAIWNGTAWRYVGSAIPSVTSAIGGTVLQVVQTNVAVNVNFAATLVTTGITASITPKATSSKILITGTTQNISHAAARDWAEFRIYKGASSVFLIDSYVGDQSTTATAMSMAGVPFNYLDSPATTSATTYTIYAKTILGNTWSIAGGSICLMEIAG